MYTHALPAPLLSVLLFALAWALAAPARVGSPWRWLVNMATVVTDTGVAWIINKLDETVQTTGDYVGWGTGAGTAGVTDTTLFTEDSGGSPAYARESATRSQPSASTIQWVATITSNGTKTITNAGNFLASSSGAPIVKGDFTGVAVEVDDAIEFTIQLQVTNT
jgi:hypothetical protein